MKIAKLPPSVAFFGERSRCVSRSVRYSGNQSLDIWGEDTAPEGAPILIFVPGGAWVSGKRSTCQGHALMARMVSLGWICLSLDYRTAPMHRWPAPLEDVTEAVFWAHDHAEEIGGDPNFIAIAGASAGGHLATLIGLSPGMVDACVGIYPSLDWTDRSSLWRKIFMEFVERVIVGHSFNSNPEVFYNASPMDRVNAYAAPILLVHGNRDVLIHVSEARKFYDRLSAVSEEAVEYLEIPGGIHAFDLVNPRHTLTANRAIAEFLTREYDLVKNFHGAEAAS